MLGCDVRNLFFGSTCFVLINGVEHQMFDIRKLVVVVKYCMLSLDTNIALNWLEPPKSWYT